MVEEMKLPRREREKAWQRQEMLEAALSLFSEKGYHNVTMHEIAGKAEFALGTLYKLFKNKEDLYKVLMLELANRFHIELMRAIEAKEDEIEKLREFVRVKGDVFRTNVSAIRLFFAETQGASFNPMAGLDSEIREMQNEVTQTIASVFASGIERNRFKGIADPYSLAVALQSITNAILILWLEAPERHPYPEDPDAVLNILFKGLVDQ